MAARPDTFQVMAKPSGPACNLDCRYCFFLDKEHAYPAGSRFRMSERVLEAYVRQHIGAHRSGETVVFTWQGGEPTLLGVDFYERAVELQRRYAGNRSVLNAFQTNGVLIDDHWARFLRRERFLVGISLDGPAALHDAHRVDKGGQPTFDRVMQGLDALRRHGVEFNTLTVVHRETARRPLEVYRFLNECGSRYQQYIPLVERRPINPVSSAGARTRGPAGLAASNPEDPGVTEWSVVPSDYGEFLVSIFDEWVRRDVGRVFVQLFDVALGIWLGQPSGLCLFRETCGDAVALGHDGAVYSCDHFVYPEYHLGNLLETELGELVARDRQRAFGEAKASQLPEQCIRCPVLFACRGECPKNRFLHTVDGEPGLNYLCAAYQRFFRHVNPAMRMMAWLVLNGRSPAEIQQLNLPGDSAGNTETCSLPSNESGVCSV